LSSGDLTELLPFSPAITVWQAIGVAVGYVAISFLTPLGLSNIPGLVDWSGSIVAFGLVWVVTRMKTDIGLVSAFEIDVRTERSRELLWKGFKYAFLLIGMQLAVIFVIMIFVVGSGQQAPEEPAYKALLGWKTNGEFLAKFILIALVAPACEELLARGLLFAGLRKKMGFKSACLISSLLFGAGHIYPIHVFVAFSLGVMLCVLAEKTRSLLPGLVCHILLNSFVMGALFLVSLASPADVPKAKKGAAETIETLYSVDYSVRYSKKLSVRAR
jgi:membrane protease YdiL (CAAX protease family)